MPWLDPWYRSFLASHHITEVYFTGQNGLHDKGASVSAGWVRLFTRSNWYCSAHHWQDCRVETRLDDGLLRQLKNEGFSHWDIMPLGERRGDVE